MTKIQKPNFFDSVLKTLREESKRKASKLRCDCGGSSLRDPSHSSWCSSLKPALKILDEEFNLNDD